MLERPQRFCTRSRSGGHWVSVTPLHTPSSMALTVSASTSCLLSAAGGSSASVASTSGIKKRGTVPVGAATSSSCGSVTETEMFCLVRHRVSPVDKVRFESLWSVWGQAVVRSSGTKWGRVRARGTTPQSRRFLRTFRCGFGSSVVRVGLVPPDPDNANNRRDLNEGVLFTLYRAAAQREFGRTGRHPETGHQ
jgi:hypothetical protein